MDEQLEKIYHQLRLLTGAVNKQTSLIYAQHKINMAKHNFSEGRIDRPRMQAQIDDVNKEIYKLLQK